MRGRLIDLLSYISCNDGCICSALDGGRCSDLDKLDRCQIQAIADHLLANGVIVQPCKVGETVWFIRNGKIIETKVDKIVLKYRGLYIKLDCNSMYETSCNSIGKTVFLTREEAERALKGGAE